LTGLAATLRAAEPGIHVRLVLEDGREVAGALRAVNGESVDLDNGEGQVDLGQVERVLLEFSPGRKQAPRQPLQR
jgi:hypothetical protein